MGVQQSLGSPPSLSPLPLSERELSWSQLLSHPVYWNQILYLIALSSTSPWPEHNVSSAYNSAALGSREGSSYNVNGE